MFRLLSHYNRFLNHTVVIQLYKTSSIRLVDKAFLSTCGLCEQRDSITHNPYIFAV